MLNTYRAALFLVLALTACGSDDTSSNVDTNADAGTDIVRDEGTADQADVEFMADYKLCLLGASSATRGPCPNADEVLDFGDVGAGQSVARLIRIDNTGKVNLNVQHVQIVTQRNELFELEFFRLANDGAVTTIQEPFNISTSGYVFIRVRFTGDPPNSSLPAESVIAQVDVASGESFEIEVPLVGQVNGCETGTADCDPLTVGCETNTLDDGNNCGGCGAEFVCGPSNICMNGGCVIGMCPSPTLMDCDGVFANGCETGIAGDPSNCGGCGATTVSGTPNPAFICPGADVLNATPSCDNRICGFGQCHEGWGDCTGAAGCETDLTTVDNCGGCGNLPNNAGTVFRCGDLYPNTQVTCESQGCVAGDCLPGFYDLDGQNFPGANGCEYACGGDPMAADVPDAEVPFLDTNCDGIDGDISKAIFVATFGDDGNAGTPAMPKKTIQNAINTALIGGKDVYVAEGTYAGPTLHLVNGVSIYGGYKADWSRSVLAIVTYVHDGSTTSDRIIGAQGSSLTATTIIDRINLQTPNAAGSSITNYGFHCTDCPGLTLRSSNITAGAGSAGLAGVNGVPGRAGGNGNPGGAVPGGACGDNGCGPAGGNGGTSPTGRVGGKGGAGGDSGGLIGGCSGAENGRTGQNGSVSGAGGGNGGSGGAKGEGGKNGNRGGDGLPGISGTNGSRGDFTWVSNYFTPTSGSAGTGGTNGHGGGGGGGGGAHACTFCNNGRGNGGGGGGGAGEGGSGGTGGKNGGSSFGIVLVNSTGATVDNNTIRAGAGGRGGDGGQGGIGGNGGNGGLGPDPCASKGGKGGDGGNGGEGGDAGHGGGGRGGYSYAVVLRSTTVSLFTNTLAFGAAGGGGVSLGNSGQPGLSGQTL